MFEREDNWDSGGASFAGRSSSRTRVRPTLNLSGRGFILHPRLLDMTFSTGLGVSLESFTLEETEKTRQLVKNYSISAQLLKEKVYPMSFFASRTTSTVSRDFFEPAQSQSQSLGGRISYNNSLIPLSLLIERRSLLYDSETSRQDILENSATLEASHKLGKNIRSSLRYGFRTLQERITGQSSHSQSLNLSNQWNFGKKKENLLSSNISLSDLRGVSETTTLSLLESLSLNHSANLSSDYRYSATKSASPAFSFTRQEAKASVRHKLYGSLVSQGFLSGNINQGDGTSQNALAGGFSLSYNKKIPYGTFSVGYNLGLSRTAQGTDSGALSIFDEAHTLTDASPSFLSNPGALLSSIIITDSAGLIRFTEGVDYILIDRGGVIEIQRLALADGSSVLVDYRFAAPLSSSFLTTAQGYSASINLFSRLKLYFSHAESSNHVLSGQDGSFLRDRIKTRFGGKFSWKWFELSGEIEDDSSELNPFTSLTTRFKMIWPVRQGTLFSFRASWGERNFKETQQKNVFTMLNSSLRSKLFSFLNLGIEAGYQTQRGGGSKSSGLRLKVQADFKIRQITLSIGNEWIRTNTLGQQQDRNFIF
ncbi:MAG: hypothetical protein V3S39_05400, partial [Thermodesulfobacteriota bacterium]